MGQRGKPEVPISGRSCRPATQSGHPAGGSRNPAVVDLGAKLSVRATWPESWQYTLCCLHCMLRQCRMSFRGLAYGSASKNYSRGRSAVAFDLELPAGCPKSGSEEFEGTAYRVVRADPPTHEDLLTYLELNLLPAADTCKRGSVSLFSTLDQAQHRLEMSPHLGNFVASVSLTARHGRVGKPSSSGHMDWRPS